MSSTVMVKSNKSGVSVFLDPNIPLEQLLEDVTRKFRENARFWDSVQTTLTLEGRGLAPEEELQIVDVIIEHSQIEVPCLLDRGANRIKGCEETLNEKLAELSLTTGQFFRGSLREEGSLKSESSIVIIGDVGKGVKVIVKGNVIALGHLMGSITAGVAGNEDAMIMASETTPARLRIADYAGRSQLKSKKLGRGPMMTCVENSSIYIKNIKKSFFSMLKSV